jgi:RNA polymerase sigma-70 factor (ECF subfamily)
MTHSENPDVRGRKEDEWLVVRCQLGDRPAFDELIDRWNGPVWKYVRRVTGEDDAAQEIMQDLWLRVLRGIHRLRDGSTLRPWLFGIARNVLMDRLRRKYAAPAVSDVDVESLADDNNSTLLEEDLAAMERELSRLPVIEREVLTLFYLRELSIPDVAAVLDVPAGTVKSRLFRARRLLRQELEGRQP